MLDLKELNILKVRFLKKLLNDNQMKGKYIQINLNIMINKLIFIFLLNHNFHFIFILIILISFIFTDAFAIIAR
jgi:hypothetical protein